jgi:integrase
VIGQLIFGSTKSHAVRLVPLTSSLAEAFAARLSGIEDDPEALVFTSPRGKVLRYQNFRNTVWLPALRSVGVAPVPIHALRHSAAAAMIHADASPKSVQVILGHASAAFTLMTYGHVFETDLDAVAERLQDVVSKAQTGPTRDEPGVGQVAAMGA